MRLICIMLWLSAICGAASGQVQTFSKIINFFPSNTEHGLQIYVEDDGYLLIVRNNCISYPNSNECRSLIKLDFDGNVLWITELDMLTAWFHNLVKLGEAYYVGGVRFAQANEVVLLKLSLLGEILGEHILDYIDPPLGIELLSKTYENELVVVSRKPRDSPQVGSVPYIMYLDSMGNLIDTIFYNEDFYWTVNSKFIETTSQKNLIAFIHCPPGVNCLNNRPSGVVCIDRDKGVQWRTLWHHGWLPAINAVEQIDSITLAVIYQTRNYTLPLDISAPPAVFYLDTFGQILDSIVLWSNHWREVAHTHSLWERGLVACGRQNLNAESSNKKGPEMAWMFRVDENRKVLWQRSYLDTTFEGRSFFFNHIKETQDRGFVILGNLTNKMVGVSETHVWLMKVDSNGCLTPGCDSINIITTTEPVAFPSGLVLTLYPNPVTAEFHLELPQEVPDQELLVSLLSSSGQVLRQQPYLHPAIRFDTLSLPPGMYYVTVHRKGSLVGVEKLVIAR